MPERADFVDPVMLIRIPKAFKLGMSDLALYEATRGVWKVGPRREQAQYALAVYQGVVQEVYRIHHWQPAGTVSYQTRRFEKALLAGRFEFVGSVAAEPIRQRYVQKSVAHYFTRGAQNPIAYVGVPPLAVSKMSPKLR